MKQVKKQLFRLLFGNIKISKHHSGFVIVLVVLIISSILSVTLLKTAWGSIVELEGGETVQGGIKSVYGVEGCMEEALLQLKRDQNYIGGTLTLQGVSCNIFVTGSDNVRDIIVHGTLEGYYEIIQAQISLSPFILTFWQ